MDSRIREIEQWVDEAKRGLDECGREEYFRKLFLLDAEIRAAIKDSGCIPEAASPQRQVKRVRRFVNPSLALSGAFGVLLLAATTVYLNGPHMLSAPAMANAARGTGQANSTYDPQLDRGHIPASIEGEEIIPFEMLLAAASQSQQPETSVTVPTGQAALDGGSVVGIKPGVMADAKPGQMKPVPASAKPQAQGKAGGSRVPSVEVVANNSTPAKSPAAANTPRNGASYSGEAFGGTIARMEDTSPYTFFPESVATDEPVNQAKDKAGKLVKKGAKDGDIVVEAPADKSSENEDEDADKLDAEALKEKLEKRFDH
jgi:hypothetical protein